LKRVLVLVGPKGAGKSTIGNLLDRTLGVRFVRVEPVFLAIKEALGSAHPDYERRGFEAVLARLTSELTAADTICFESTGASREFAWLLSELRKLARVLPVHVLAEPSQCLDRIHRRDASIHIPVSDDQVSRINELAFQVELPWVAQVDNRSSFAPDLIVQQMRNLLRQP
jgi:shikimate kinase